MQKFEVHFQYLGGGSDRACVTEEERESLVRWFRRDPPADGGAELLVWEDPDVYTLSIEGGKGELLVDRTKVAALQVYCKCAAVAA
jgi:hypothetical protein